MTLQDPRTLDWGSMSKREFKRNELAYELAHEDAIPQRARKKSNARTLPLKSVSLIDALAVSYAAYRINDNTYVKHTRRFSEKDNKTVFANKDLVRYYWEKKTSTSNYSENNTWMPQDFEMFEPNQDDYASAEEARVWMKRYIMLGLDANLNGFTQDMIKELQKSEVPVVGMGRIAYAPEFIKRDQHENGLKKTIRIEYRDSKHLGAIKDSVEGVIEILDKRYSSQYEMYFYTAVIEGNLVSFGNKFEHAVGDRKRITAKIKGLTKNRLFSADETRLNYVKLYKV